MKKPLVCLLCVLLALLTSCGQPASTEAAVPVLRVVICDGDADTYLAVYPHGETAEIGEFDPDTAAFYTAAHGDFFSSIENNRVRNALIATTLIDTNGNQVEADRTIAAMMQAAADTITHDIWKFHAITVGSRCFAFVELNVNWQSPCILYEYDAAQSSLTELCRWDGVELVGISVP